MDSFTPESFALGIEIIVCLGSLYGTFYVGQPQHSVKVSVLVVVLWFLLSGSENALAQTTQTTSTATAPSTFPSILKDGVTLPDWSKISFDSMAPFTEGGAVAMPPEAAGSLGFDKIEWKPGQKIADALPLGAIQGCLGFESLTQKGIDGITGQVSSTVGLDKFLPTGLQSIKSLNDIVPNLSQKLVGDVKPIADLVQAGLSGKLPNFDLNSLQGFAGQLTGGGAQGAQQILDSAGGLVGSLSNGQFLDTAGNLVGQVNGSGQVLDTAGNALGSLNQSGQFVNQAGQVVGALSNPTGTITQAATQAVGQQLGQVTSQLPGGAGQLLNGASLQSLTVGQLTEKFPQLAALGMKNLDLSQYTMSQIPGLENTPIKQFANWEQVLMKGIPGLSKIPFNQFPSPLKEAADAYVARVDVPLDSEEQNRDRSLSGSYKEGFRVACTENCEHAELSPIQGSQMDAASVGAFANGKSWMSKKQMVQGGEGILGRVNGGKEPTVVTPTAPCSSRWSRKLINQAGRSAPSMYLRICKRGMPDLGCTPYFIGPLPFLTYNEKQFIYLGAGNPKDDGSGIGFPGSDDPLSATDGFDDCGGTKLSGESVTKATGAVEKVAKRLGAGTANNDGAFSTSSANGAKHIPRILAALKEEGITDPNQVAYVLATVHRETSFVNLEEGGTRLESSGGSQYWGRGYVQLTHKANYQSATNYLKSKGMNVDLVANPELAKRPDIAAKVLAYGMRTGKLYGNGTTLNSCAGSGRVDWVKCRWIVNDGAEAESIAQAAKIYRDAIATSNLADAKSESSSGCTAPKGGKPCPPGQKCLLQNPLPGGLRTSPFGPRNGRLHAGVDLQTTKGYNAHPTGPGGQVLAAADGRVIEYTPVGGRCGGVIGLSHPQLKLETRYLHMVKLLVPKGATVARGQPLGLEGNETPGSCSGGVHLHYEIYSAGGGAIDPMQFEHSPPLGRR
jgi:predicted chitinase